MTRQHKDAPARVVTVEVSRSYLRMVAVERQVGNRPAEVRTRSYRWRHESNTLHSEAGVQELTRAFKQMAADERLAGGRLRVTLSGDFCVTRVLTGADERVRRELAQLEERSQRYLTLGPGHKALAGSIRQIDARHQHALLTVSNQKTLDTLLQVATTVGVHIEWIEPSLVALSRVLGRLGHDHDQPALIINVDERGVELGISYDGQLLLDYRPGGREIHGEAAQIVVQHLARLRRYCQRYFRYAKGELDRAYLCGAPEYLEAVRQGFLQSGALRVETLDPSQLDLNWRFADERPASDLAAAIGTCLIPAGGDPERPSPNLIEHLDQHLGDSRFQILLRLGWPIAAALLLALGLWGVNYRVASRCAALRADLAAVEPIRAQAQHYRLTMARAALKQDHFTTIEHRLAAPAWSELLETIGRCLPADVWLDHLQLEPDGKLRLAGTSYGEEGVFELVGWLEKSPLLTAVALQGTGYARFEGGDFTQFQVECKLQDNGDLAVD